MTTTGAASKVAVILATDEAYFGLAKDLVGSLIANALPAAPFEIACLDIGLSEGSRTWMRSRGVRLHQPDADRLSTPLRQIVSARPYMMAQLYRPYMPEMAPEADVIIHIDCDAWVQNGEFITACVDAVNAAPDNIVLAPSTSHYTASFYNDIEKILQMQYNWTFGCYEKSTADRLAQMSFFSSGVFAARPGAPVWARWAEEINRMVPLVAVVNPPVLHLAEQTALNGVVRLDHSVTVLDPIFNFHCNAGGVKRDPATGKVVTALVHPHREISVVHLADWRRRKDEYVEAKVVFNPAEPPVTF